MHQDGWRIGHGMATARYDVPALERIHATLPAALRARSYLPARGAGRTGDHLDRAATAHRRTPRLGADPLKRDGSPVPIPMTVQPATGWFTTCVVRT